MSAPRSRERWLVVLMAVGLWAWAASGCRQKPATTVSQKPSRTPLPYRCVTAFCYHELTATPKSLYDLKPEELTAQLQILREGGYKSLTAEELADYLAGQKDIPARAVLLSFDDGRRSVLTVAKPLLERYGFRAVLFINPATIGGRGFLRWEELQMLAQAGFEINSHTMTHLNLTRKPKKKSWAEFHAAVRREIAQSYQEIAARLGRPPVALAYPYGNYDEAVMRMAKEAGYRLAFSIDPGAIDPQSEPYALPRRMIVRGTSRRTFARYLETQPLHLTERTPPLGQRVPTRAYQFTARLAEPALGPSLQGEGGRGLRLRYDATSQCIQLTTRLARGANLIRLWAPGPPRRETAWLVISDASE